MMTREQLVLSVAPLIDFEARSIARRAPSELRHDLTAELVQSGWVAVLEIADDYDPSRGSFWTFAYQRIRGEMFDYLRKILGRRHAGFPVRLRKGITADRVLRSKLHFTSIENSGKCNFIDQHAQEDFKKIEARIDLGAVLNRARMPTRYKRMLFAYYWRQETMIEIGKELHVNESRVSQIHKAALKKVRAAAA